MCGQWETKGKKKNSQMSWPCRRRRRSTECWIHWRASIGFYDSKFPYKRSTSLDGCSLFLFLSLSLFLTTSIGLATRSLLSPYFQYSYGTGIHIEKMTASLSESWDHSENVYRISIRITASSSGRSCYGRLAILQIRSRKAIPFPFLPSTHQSF